MSSGPYPEPLDADTWLRHGEQGLRLLAEQSRDVFYVTDPDPLRLLYVNPAYEEVWGRSRESLYRNLSSFVEAVHPDDRLRVAAALPRQIQGLQTDEEYRIVRPDGSLRWIRDRAMPVRNAAGQVYRIVGIAADITYRRRTEEVLRLLDEASLLLNASLDYTTTLRGVAQLVVPRLADICVVDVLDESGTIRRLEVAHADKEWSERLRELAARHPPRLVNPAHPLEQAIASGAPQLVPTVTPAFLEIIEHEAERLDVLKELAPISAMVVPLVARDRTLGAVTLVTTTRSGRRYGSEDMALAAELAQRAATAMDHAALYEAAVLANKSKADFLAVVSHELRTPLSAIIGYAELLEMGVGGDLNDVQRTRVERIKSGAGHLARLIEGILAYARLETSREKVVSEPLELCRVVRESVALVEPVAEQKGLVLRLDLPEAPLPLASDEAKIKQILLNVLHNAVKFTEAGGVRVTVRDAGDALAVDVADTGIGIEPEHQDRIFEAFWQVEQSLTRRIDGTGLGLAVSRRLAQLLGGEVSVASAPGAGSTFTVRLPRAEGLATGGDAAGAPFPAALRG